MSGSPAMRSMWTGCWETKGLNPKDRNALDCVTHTYGWGECVLHSWMPPAANQGPAWSAAARGAAETDNTGRQRPPCLQRTISICSSPRPWKGGARGDCRLEGAEQRCAFSYTITLVRGGCRIIPTPPPPPPPPLLSTPSCPCKQTLLEGTPQLDGRPWQAVGMARLLVSDSARHRLLACTRIQMLWKPAIYVGIYTYILMDAHADAAKELFQLCVAHSTDRTCIESNPGFCWCEG